MWYPLSTPPDGWLECNGQATAAYPTLAALIGTNVPDLRGNFIRGWDHGSGIDINRMFGSLQLDQNRAHNHGLIYSGGFVASGFSINAGVPIGANSSITNSYNWNDGGSEARPRNIALLPCIKY